MTNGNLFHLLVEAGRITEEVVEQMRSWLHSGFSVDSRPQGDGLAQQGVSERERQRVKLPAGDSAAVQRLMQYMVRCPFSLDRMISVGADGKVIYRAESRAEGETAPPSGERTQ